MSSTKSRSAGTSRLVLASLVGALILASLVAAYSLPSRGQDAIYADHAPILIVGNSGFTPENGTVGGSGTELDPYIIEGWNITAGTTDGIAVMNTDAHFVIRNVHVHDSASPGVGIFINSSSHGTVENSILDNHEFSALSIGNSDNITARNNTMSNGMQGVWMYNSENTTLRNNSISTFEYGVTVYQSSTTVIENNLTAISAKSIYLFQSNDSAISGNSIYLCVEGVSLRRNSLRNLISDNEIHGEYLAGAATAIHLEEFSSDNTIQSNNISDISTGVFVEYCHRTNVSGNIARNISLNGFVQFGYSDDCVVSFNEVVDCWLGISVSASSRCLVMSNNISDCYYGITDSFGTGQNISGNDILQAGERGLTLDHTHSTMVSSNHIADCGGDAVSLNVADQPTLIGNTIANNQGWGVSCMFSSSLEASLNAFTSNGIFLQGSTLGSYNSHTITPDNTVNSKPLIYHANENGVAISGEDVGELLLAGCANINVSNLTIADSDLGIQVAYCENVSVDGCNLSLQKKGLQVVSSDAVLIEKTQAGWNDAGVEILGSSGVRVSNCTMHDDVDVGLFLDTCDNLTVSDERISSSGTGFYLWDCDNISVTENRLESNDIGFWVDSSTSILVFHNDFLDNVIQAQTQFTSDHYQLNSTYPTGGNYWSSYTGADHKSGPNQDGPGSDGIGDDPFVLTAEITDYYPLMSPVTTSNTAPVASFVVDPASGDLTTLFALDASTSSDLEDPLSALEVRWDWDGDGSYDTDWTTDKTASHQFVASGTYNVTLEVRDPSGLTNTTTVTVEVADAIPEFSDLLIPVLGLALLVSLTGRRKSH